MNRPRDRLGRPLPPGSEDELRQEVDREEIVRPIPDVIDFAMRLFDEQRFFEAHEHFEHVWRSPELPEGERDFWKGVTQVAVGFCHVQRGNPAGAATVLRRAADNLAHEPNDCRGLDGRKLRDSACRVASDLEHGTPTGKISFPQFPRRLPAPRRSPW